MLAIASLCVIVGSVYWFGSKPVPPALSYRRSVQEWNHPSF